MCEYRNTYVYCMYTYVYVYACMCTYVYVYLNIDRILARYRCKIKPILPFHFKNAVTMYFNVHKCNYG